MFSLKSTGSFKNTEDFLRKAARINPVSILDALAKEGAAALASATPADSGLAAQSWSYQVEKSSSGCTISWINTDIENGFPVVVMLQYGYATGTGGYVRGRDFINPAIQPIMDKIADRLWKEVTSV